MRTPSTLVALAAIALTGVGCGSSAPSKADGSGTGATTQTKAVRFSECMRTHGVKAFPDPDAAGELTVDGVANDAKVNVQSAAFERAIRACKDLQPAGFTGGKRTPKQQSATLRFAACIRENGVKDFPDPAIGQPPVDTRRIPSANRPGGMDVLNAAMKQCGAVLDLAAGGQR